MEQLGGLSVMIVIWQDNHKRHLHPAMPILALQSEIKIQITMKIKFLTAWLVCWALGAMAQEEMLTITPVKKGDEPKAVLDAIKTDFPSAVAKDLSFLPSKLYGKEWNVQLAGSTDEDIQFYQVQIAEKDVLYTAVYDKDGKLLSSKEMIKTSRLPSAVVASVKKFSDWKMIESHEVIKTKGSKARLYYKVRLQKGMEHKNVFLDPQGNILSSPITV